MTKLPSYNSFEEKNSKFLNHFTFVKTEKDFDLWYSMFDDKSPNMKTSQLFRGMSEASYKLYCSGQRYWLKEDMDNKLKGDHSYLKFISSLVSSAKQNKLFKRVFELYSYDDQHENEFPILSLLQHYGAPTPLLDLTYNVDIALYFATENIDSFDNSDQISNYFSVYLIWKPDYLGELKNLIEIYGYYPPVLNFVTWDDDSSANVDGSRMLCYISDFDKGNTTLTQAANKINVKNDRPLTLLYNQNIIPQEGLFIFNPFSKMSLEDVILSGAQEDQNPNKFRCFNIKKDLVPYIKSKVLQPKAIDKAYVYPDLRDDSKQILANTIKMTEPTS